MPTILFEASRYCMGGSVALVEIVSVPALTRSALPTLGVQPVGAAAADDEDESLLPQAVKVRRRAAAEEAAMRSLRTVGSPFSGAGGTGVQPGLVERLGQAEQR